MDDTPFKRKINRKGQLSVEFLLSTMLFILLLSFFVSTLIAQIAFAKEHQFNVFIQKRAEELARIMDSYATNTRHAAMDSGYSNYAHDEPDCNDIAIRFEDKSVIGNTLYSKCEVNEEYQPV